MEYEQIGFIQGKGSNTTPADYSFTDKNLSLNGSYTYRLKQIDYDGRFRYSKEETINYVAAEVFKLSQNYPNPFNPTTAIKYETAKTSLIKITVYDILGKEIAILVNEVKAIGKYEVSFNATNLSSGIYLYTMQAGDFIQYKKTALMK